MTRIADTFVKGKIEYQLAPDTGWAGQQGLVVLLLFCDSQTLKAGMPNQPPNCVDNHRKYNDLVRLEALWIARWST